MGDNLMLAIQRDRNTGRKTEIVARIGDYRWGSGE